jgi:hypothetical protein
MTKDEQIKRIVDREILVLANQLGEKWEKTDGFLDEIRNLEFCECPKCYERVPCEVTVCPYCEHECEDWDRNHDEIMQWWIVTEWLQQKLEAQGEPVGEYLGLPLWGRTGCGYSLEDESAIKKIAELIATE